MASPANTACYDVSSEAKDAIERDDWAEVARILSECSCRDSDSVMTQLVSRDQWDAVKQVIRCLSDDQLESALTVLVTLKQWKAAGLILKRGVSNIQRRWAHEQCIQHGRADEFQHFLPEGIRAGDEWVFVMKSLLSGFQGRDDDKRRLMSSITTGTRKGLLPRNMKEHLKDLLRGLEQDPCSELDGVLYLCVRLTNPIVTELSQNACCRLRYLKTCGEKLVTEVTFTHFVLPYLSDKHLNSVLTHLVRKHRWAAVDRVLQRGVSNDMHNWAVEECTKYAHRDDFIAHVFPHFADDQRDSMLVHLVTRGQWKSVDTVLNRGVRNVRHNWAVKEGIKKAKSDDIIKYVLPHCAVDQLDYVMIQLVTRLHWRAVGKVLPQVVNKARRRWALKECSKKATNDDFIKYILPHCASDELDCVLTQLEIRGHWKAIDKVLSQGVSNVRHRWAVKRCSKKAKSDDFIHFALHQCADEQLDSVLIHLVRQSQWKAVDRVLHQGVSNARHRWAVEECSKKTYSDDFIKYALSHCPDDQLDFVLTPLVTRGQWKAVDRVLRRGVSNARHRWAVEECSKNATSDDFIEHALPHCADDQLDSVLTHCGYLHDSVLTHLIRRDFLEAVGKTLHQGITTADNMNKTRIRNQDKQVDSFLRFIFPRDYAIVLPLLVEHGKQDLVGLVLDKVVAGSLHQWGTGETRLPQGDEEASLNDVDNCHIDIDLMLTMRLFKAVLVVGEDGQARRSHLGLKEDLYEVLYMSLVHNVCVALCSDDNSLKHINDPVNSCVPEIYHNILSCMRNITVGCSVEAIIDQWHKQDSKLPPEPFGVSKHSSSSTNMFVQFLQQFNLYYQNRRGENDDDILLTMFAVLPLFPELQSVALRVMLRHKRWDVISHACLSRVWEQDRWQLLKAAVKQRQWSVVSKWADHTLYDDQRVWALNEALNEKQWDVALLLADHGLTDIELMQVRYRVAKYADWDVVLRMFERGGDVAEIRERLGRMREGKRIPENVKRNIARTHIDALNLETKMQGKKSHKDLRKYCQESNWTLVLYSLVRCPRKTSHHMALKAAVKKKAWHVVTQLVRLGMDTAKRDSFFSRMMRRQQWGVCRALLERGLSVQVCLDALPHLLEMNQWTLVARVMEHEVDDAVKQQVMQRAWERREGSVVWLCIKSLPAPLSVEEREALFQRAFSCEIWQVIKPLIEEKDETGIRHRDTALLEAIEQHQWDVVDHCQRHHADINMKDDDGNTPIHRAARKGDWEAVKELTVRDGDPNLLDSEGLSVLHRAIRAEQWDLVKLLIQFHGDIHQAARYKIYTTDSEERTPLPMLIYARQGEVIELTLMWCPDQQKVVNNERETVLHAVCLSGWPGALYHLLARKVDPLAVTYAGHTALCYAVLCKDCPQRMVAECIKLGFSTHQSHITHTAMQTAHYRTEQHKMMMSPLVLAVMRGLPVVTQMLYESGACSNRQLRKLNVHLDQVTQCNTDERRAFRSLFWSLWKYVHHQSVNDPGYSFDGRLIEQSAAYLREMCSTPRSLVSTCRLVISRRLTLSKTRHRDIAQLPLLPKMKDYLMFSDLTDPRYPDLSYRGKE